MGSPASRALLAACLPLAFALCAAGANAQTVKVGIAGPFSGPFAHYGKLFKDGAEAYVASQGGKLAGQTIEFIYRDTGGPNPAGTRNLAQELIIKDKVDYLGGFVFTPNAFAVAPLIQESKTPTVIFNAATSAITTKSDYFVRTSYTLWQVTVPMAQHAYKKGMRKVVTAVTDYAPGVDAENSFKAEFARMGGEVTESIRMPIKTTDFAPFAQRIKASGAQAVYVFLPGGPPNLGFVKAYNENGLREAGVEFLGTAEMDEFDLQKFGQRARTEHGLPLFGRARLGREPQVRGGTGPAVEGHRRELCIGRRLGRHARHPQNDRGNRRQARRRQGDGRRQGPQMGEPARAGVDRSPDTPHHAERLPAHRREGHGPVDQQGSAELRPPGRSRAGQVTRGGEMRSGR